LLLFVGGQNNENQQKVLISVSEAIKWNSAGECAGKAQI
jgi:hypothetical protein